MFWPSLVVWLFTGIHSSFADAVAVRSFHWRRSLAFVAQLDPKCRSSAHLRFWRPTFLWLFHGSHVVVLCAYLFWSFLMTWPAHFHLVWVASVVASLMFVLFLRSSLRILSCSLTPRIFLSIFFWYVCNIFVSLHVRAQVWAPYSRRSRIQASIMSFFSFMLYAVLVRMNLRPQNLDHAAEMRRWTSLHVALWNDTVLNYTTSNDPLYVRFEINFLLWIYYIILAFIISISLKLSHWYMGGNSESNLC